MSALQALEESLMNLINKGEHENLEFKSSLRTNMHTKEFDSRLEHSILKTINAYLNSNGGTLLVGVSDKERTFKRKTFRKLTDRLGK